MGRLGEEKKIHPKVIRRRGRQSIQKDSERTLESKTIEHVLNVNPQPSSSLFSEEKNDEWENEDDNNDEIDSPDDCMIYPMSVGKRICHLKTKQPQRKLSPSLSISNDHWIRENDWKDLDEDDWELMVNYSQDYMECLISDDDETKFSNLDKWKYENSNFLGSYLTEKGDSDTPISNDELNFGVLRHTLIELVTTSGITNWPKYFSLQSEFYLHRRNHRSALMGALASDQLNSLEYASTDHHDTLNHTYERLNKQTKNNHLCSPSKFELLNQELQGATKNALRADNAGKRNNSIVSEVYNESNNGRNYKDELVYVRNKATCLISTYQLNWRSKAEELRRILVDMTSHDVSTSLSEPLFKSVCGTMDVMEFLPAFLHCLEEQGSLNEVNRKQTKRYRQRKGSTDGLKLRNTQKRLNKTIYKNSDLEETMDNIYESLDVIFDDDGDDDSYDNDGYMHSSFLYNQLDDSKFFPFDINFFGKKTIDLQSDDRIIDLDALEHDDHFRKNQFKKKKVEY